MIVRVERHELGARLHVGRVRIHHFHSGLALVALGTYLIVWDRRDVAAVLHRSRFDPEIGITTTNAQGGW